jgi:hypothetical protein
MPQRLDGGNAAEAAADDQRCGLLDLPDGREMTDDSRMFTLTICQRQRGIGKISLLACLSTL